MLETDASLQEILAYAHSRGMLEEALTTIRLSKQELEDCVTEFKAIGLNSLAALLEEKKEEASEVVRFCTWTLSRRSLEEMKACRLPHGTCNCWLNREYNFD